MASASTAFCCVGVERRAVGGRLPEVWIAVGKEVSGSAVEAAKRMVGNGILETESGRVLGYGKIQEYKEIGGINLFVNPLLSSVPNLFFT